MRACQSVRLRRLNQAVGGTKCKNQFKAMRIKAMRIKATVLEERPTNSDFRRSERDGADLCPVAPEFFPDVCERRD